MKIREILSETDQLQPVNANTFSSPREPKRRERMERSPLGAVDPNYTPGKEALDREYEIVDDFTKTKIPHVQKKLDDPRN